MTLQKRPLRFGRIALVAMTILVSAVAARAQTISGAVREADNGPLLRSMVVAAYTPQGNLQANTTTNTSGHYDLALPPGQYRVLAYDPTGAHATQFANDAPSFEESPLITVNNGQTTNVDFALPKGVTVTGTVITSGGPRQGLIVAAYNLSGTRRGFATTNGAGGYSIVLPAGTYKLVAYDDAGAFATAFFRDQTSFADATPVTLQVGKPAPSVDFFLQLASRVSGIVTDINSVPLANIAVLAYTPAGKFVSYATTGADGRFTFSLVPGAYRFVAIDPSFTYAAGFAGNAPSFEATQTVTMNAGQTKNDVTFRLERGGMLAGQVVDATSGAGLAGIVVAAYNPDGTMRTSVTTDANGRYVLLLPTGNFRIAAFDPNLVYATQFMPQQTSFVRATAISATIGQTITLPTFSLSHGGRVAGTITDQFTHVGIAGAVIYAYDSTGVLVGQTITSQSGAYQLVLPAGTYRIVAADPSLRYAPGYMGASNFDTANTITVATDATTSADIALQRGTLVNGSIVDTTHAGIAGAQITALDMNQNRVATATTAADGSFQLALVPGAYKFVITDPLQRHATTYFGGSTFATATVVTIDATGAPRLTVTLQGSPKRRAVRHS